MNSKSHEFPIDPKAPFYGDPLGRDVYALNLTRLVGNTETPLVMTISAPWGQGKTTFIRMWQQHLKNEGFKTVYFDAWTNDYIDDPLASFIDVLEEAMSSKDIHGSAVLELYSSLKKKGQALIKVAAKPAVKNLVTATGTIITGGDPNAAPAVEAAGDLASDYAHQRLNRAASIREQIEGFKKNLRVFAKKVSRGPKPLIVIVDELDRCRPDYTIELLEKIKHLFSVEGVCFVLSVDRTRLGIAAANRIGFSSGNAGDADGYLRRFIDIDFYLPPPNSHSFLLYCGKKLNLPDQLVEIYTENCDAFGMLADHLELSLRDELQIVSRLKVIATVSPTHPIGVWMLIVSYLIIASKDRAVVRSALNPPYAGLERIREILFSAVHGKGESDAASGIHHLLKVHGVLFDDNTGGSTLSNDERSELINQCFGRRHRSAIPKFRNEIWQMMEFSMQFESQ